MSKLDREITAIIDDMASQANSLIPEIVAIMVDDELSESEQTIKIANMLKESQPKTYEIYIADLKQVFREAGWKEPELNNAGD